MEKIIEKYIEETTDNEFDKSHISKKLYLENCIQQEVQLDLSIEERIKIFKSFNNTYSDYPKNRTVKELFEEQVEKNKDAIAIIETNHEWTIQKKVTYKELNEKVNKMANFLIKKGVSHETIVAILSESNIECIIAILAIIKAGGSYLPIDTLYPKERIDLLINDAQPVLILCQEKYKTIIDSNIPTFNLLNTEMYDGNANNPTTVHNPNSLLYIMYTSGSTGKPKGVMVEHRNVVRLVKNTNYISFSNKERILQIGAMAFDASTFEIWGSLLNGGTLYLTSKETILTQYKLEEIIKNCKITSIFLTSSLFNQLAEEKSDMFKTLKNLLVGGDVLNPKYINLVREICPELSIKNAYGPTENTTFSVCFNIEQKYEKSIPIGHPINNSTAYILNKKGDLLPPGIPGELCVGGDGVARGYLNNKELTEEKFIIPKFINELKTFDKTKAKERIYKTGDLAMWREDGSIEFLGRVDNQIKIRGFRIELGEIDEVLLTHKNIKQSLTMMKKDEWDNKYLCSYIVASKKTTRTDLRNFLLNKLPEYMVPTAFVQLETMPLNVNGKIDKLALPEPIEEVEYMNKEAKTEIQHKIAKYIEGFLGINKIGIDEDFFELGIHSLLVSQLVKKINQDMGIEITLTDVFNHSTVEKLAEKIENSKKRVTLFPSMKKATQNQKIPLTYQQQQIWVLLNLARNNKAYNFQFTINFKGKLDKTILEKALTEIIRRHQIMYTTFHNIDGEPVQVIEEPWEAKITEVDLTHLNEEERKKEVEKEIYSEMEYIFDITKLPLINWKIYKLDEEDYLFLHIEHHFIHDGWSISLILEELKTLYEAYYRGNESPLKELTYQYADYAVWQRELMAGAVAENQLQYWKQQLKNSPERLSLKTDKLRPKTQSFNGDIIRIDLPEEIIEKLNMFCKKFGYTLYMTLYSAFTYLLYTYTGQEDILIGTGIANRRKDTEPIIGMFVNSIVLRSDLRGDIDFMDLLERTKTVVLQAHENQDLPLEKIVKDLNIKRHTDINPFFQVMFGFHDSPVPDLEFANLKGHLLERHNGSAKTDINLICIPRGQQRRGREERTEDNRFTLMWEYNSDLFYRETMEEMISKYITLVDDVIKQPHRKLSGLSQQKYSKISFENNKKEHETKTNSADIETTNNKQQNTIIKPQDTLEKEIYEMWCKLLHTRSIGIDDNFYEKGGHSLLAIRFLTILHKQMNVDIELSDFNQNPTIKECCKMVNKSENTILSNKTLLVGLKTEGVGQPLFCVSPPGANVTHKFNHLVSCLEKEQKFYGIQPPSIGGERERIQTVEEIAASCVEELLHHFPQNTYKLGGLCSGGIIAFEMARQLIEKGKKVDVLILMDTISYFANENKILNLTENQWFTWFGRDLGRNLAKYYGGNINDEFGITTFELENKEYEEKLTYVLEKAKKMRVISEDTQLEELHHAYKYFYDNNIKNINILSQYKAQPFYSNTVLLLNKENKEEMEEKSRGWASVLKGSVNIHDIPGNHDTILDTPNVIECYSIIKKYL